MNFEVFVGAGIASMAWVIFGVGCYVMGYIRTNPEHRHEFEVTMRSRGIAFGECEICNERMKARLV